MLNYLLRTATGHKVNMYHLIEILHNISEEVLLTCRLVSAGKLKKHQKKSYIQKQSQIFQLWQDYAATNMPPLRFIKKMTKFHHPVEPKTKK